MLAESSIRWRPQSILDAVLIFEEADEIFEEADEIAIVLSASARWHHKSLSTTTQARDSLPIGIFLDERHMANGKNFDRPANFDESFSCRDAFPLHYSFSP